VFSLFLFYFFLEVLNHLALLKEVTTLQNQILVLKDQQEVLMEKCEMLFSMEPLTKGPQAIDYLLVGTLIVCCVALSYFMFCSFPHVVVHSRPCLSLDTIESLKSSTRATSDCVGVIAKSLHHIDENIVLLGNEGVNPTLTCLLDVSRKITSLEDRLNLLTLRVSQESPLSSFLSEDSVAAVNSSLRDWLG